MILIVCLGILILKIINGVGEIDSASKDAKPLLIAVFVLEIAEYLFIGPALGILFISHATHVEELQSLRYRVAALEFSNKKVDPKKSSKQDSKILEKEEDNDEQSKTREPVDLSVWSKLR